MAVAVTGRGFANLAREHPWIADCGPYVDQAYPLFLMGVIIALVALVIWWYQQDRMRDLGLLEFTLFSYATGALLPIPLGLVDGDALHGMFLSCECLTALLAGACVVLALSDRRQQRHPVYSRAQCGAQMRGNRQKLRREDPPE